MNVHQTSAFKLIHSIRVDEQVRESPNKKKRDYKEQVY